MINGDTTYKRPSELTHYPALDGLRAVAFLLVMLTHYYRLPWGFGGVNFFFVLSGFLITGILYDTRDQPDRARRFYTRRALRIFPLYYGVILMVFLFQPVFRWHWTWPWVAWPLYLGNFLRLWGHGVRDPGLRSVAYARLQSSVHPGVILYFGHFWSLCVEEQFYLLWPWVVFSLRSRRWLLTICASAVALCPLARSLAENHTPAWMSRMEFTTVVGVPFQLDALLLGGLLALLWRSDYRHLLQKTGTGALCLLTLGALAYIVHTIRLYPVGQVRSLYRYPDWRTTWDLSLLNIYGAALLVCALRPGSLTYRALNWKALRYLGRISYGAYVFHDVPHLLYKSCVERFAVSAHLRQDFSEPATFVVALFVTIALASVSYRYFELPFLKLKERWAPVSRSPGSVMLVSDEATVGAL